MAHPLLAYCHLLWRHQQNQLCSLLFMLRHRGKKMVMFFSFIVEGIVSVGIFSNKKYELMLLQVLYKVIRLMEVR